LRILVADDQEQVRKRICTILASHSGYEICAEAANGQEAVEKTKKMRPDLIVLDISMPVLNGLEAARIIREFAPNIPIVVVSVHKSKQLIEEAKALGVRGYVAKEDVVEDLTRATETASLNRDFFPRGL